MLELSLYSNDILQHSIKSLWQWKNWKYLLYCFKNGFQKAEISWKITAAVISNHRKITIDSIMFMSSCNDNVTNAQQTSTWFASEKIILIYSRCSDVFCVAFDEISDFHSMLKTFSLNACLHAVRPEAWFETDLERSFSKSHQCKRMQETNAFRTSALLVTLMLVFHESNSISLIKSKFIQNFCVVIA